MAMAEDSPSSASAAADHRRPASATSCCSESSLTAACDHNDDSNKEEQLLLVPSSTHDDATSNGSAASSGQDEGGTAEHNNSDGNDMAQDVPEEEETNGPSSTASKDETVSPMITDNDDDDRCTDKAAISDSNNRPASTSTSTNTETKRSSSSDNKFDFNGGRRPDMYDAYSHRLDVRYWSSPALHGANSPHLPDMCLVEFCRRYTVGTAGRSEGKIRYHGRGVITAPTLRFHPEYSSDPNWEGGKDYGQYCRFALVRYRPWADAPFGRVTNVAEAGTTGNDNDDRASSSSSPSYAANAGVEHKPTEEECIEQWREYLAELRPRMHQIPDVLLPDELKGVVPVLISWWCPR